MKFLDVKTDYAFKKVFGSEESVPLLKSFLNAVLGYKDDKAITELEILDPYLVPRLKGMKDTFVDVKAKLSNGKRIIIEMQVLNVNGFENRILFNAAKQYSQQLVKGEKYDLLNPVIALTFTDFNMFNESTEAISQFKLMETTQLITYSDDVELIFVELPKFTKNSDELDDIKDKWIYFVKNAGDLTGIPESLNEPCIHQAFDVVNEAGLNIEELELQEKRYDFIRMQQGALDLAIETGIAKGLKEGHETGREEGREEGLEEGHEIGREEGVFETAKMMIDEFKLSPKEVAKKLSISLDKLLVMLDKNK